MKYEPDSRYPPTLVHSVVALLQCVAPVSSFAPLWPPFAFFFPKKIWMEKKKDREEI
jgi:hypothetical protein